MSNIIAFASGAQLPAYMKNREVLAAINQDVATAATFATLSIKGKVFTLVKGSERKVLTHPDDPDQTLQFLQLTAVRANTKSRVFYAKAYSDGDEGETARPDCYSSDGDAPAADARSPQSKKCATCPHAVWGSKPAQPGQEAKGTACSVNTRLAVIDPTQVGDQLEPYLLRVPAGSRRNFSDVVKAADTRGIPYNALVLKVGFDKEAPSPKLTFKLVGLVDDATYDKVSQAYDGDVVKEMLGYGPVRAALPAPEAAPAQTEADADMDAILAAKAAQQAAAATKRQPEPVGEADLDALLAGAAPAPAAPKATRTRAKAPAPAPAPVEDVQPVATPAPTLAPAPVQAPPPPAAAPAPSADASGLLGELDGLLDGFDD